MKNKLTSLLLIILIIIPTIMGLVVISSFIFIGFNHYQDFINISNLGEYGQVGDFFSGHINGFILLTIIVSLYFQRVSIKQTWESIKQQSEANQTISEDLKRSIEANELQTREFITTNYKNDFNEEIKYIQSIEKDLNLEYLYDNEFKKSHKLNNQKLFELFRRKDYLAKLIDNIKDIELQSSLRHKFESATMGRYNNKNQELLENVFSFNEILSKCSPLSINKFCTFLVKLLLSTILSISQPFINLICISSSKFGYLPKLHRVIKPLSKNFCCSSDENFILPSNNLSSAYNRLSFSINLYNAKPVKFLLSVKLYLIIS